MEEHSKEEQTLDSCSGMREGSMLVEIKGVLEWRGHGRWLLARGARVKATNSKLELSIILTISEAVSFSIHNSMKRTRLSSGWSVVTE